MTCSHCGHGAADQATFCSRCGTRFGPPHRSVVREFLITRVARPWWCFMRESTMAFSIVAGFYLSLFGVLVWVLLRNFSPLPNGFSSPMSANKANFAKVINAHLAKECIGINPGSLAPFPVSVVASDDRSFAQYNALTNAGLLSATDTLVQPTIGGIPLIRAKVPGRTYSLTDEGRRVLEDPGSATFCAGHYKVDEVLDFTVPGNAMGATISEVLYMYSPSDVPTWVSSFDIQSAFPNLAQQLARKQESRITVVLTNNGWQVNTP
jgi:hypothetical protein